MTKKKTVVIIIVIAAVLLMGYLAVSVIVPRVLLSVYVDEYIGDISENTQLFTHYEVTADYETFTLDNGHIALDISSEFEKADVDFETTQLYRKGDNVSSFIMMNAEDNSEFSLLNSADYSVAAEQSGISYTEEQLRKGFESIGKGIPDSSYTTLKCIYTLDKSDYSFWNFNQAVAYTCTAILKQQLPVFGDVYLYISDDIRGFAQIQNHNNPEMAYYSAMVDLYRSDDYNTRTTIMINAQTIEEIYAIMNSARAAG